MPQARGVIRWAVDRVAAWFWGLPVETCSYTVDTFQVPISTTHDISLVADLYQPTGGVKPTATVVSMSPYGRGVAMAVATVRLFASRGYQGLLVSVRGTFGSGGVFDAGSTNTVDAQAIVAWMQEQPWYTGSFAMVGGSYLGLTQWATLENQPSDMAAAVIAVGPHDLGRYVWGTGALNLDLLTWANIIAHQDSNWDRLRMYWNKKSLQSIFTCVPLADEADRYFNNKTPWLRERIVCSDLTDPFWKPMQHLGAVEKATVPILLVSGWQDVFLDQTMAQYRTLQKRGVQVALTVGPWHHTKIYSETVMFETYQWLEQHLAKRPDARRQSPVRFYVTGANEWRTADIWPLSTTPKILFLYPGMVLAEEKPRTGSKESTFTFDPENPTPAVGGPRLSHSEQYIDNALTDRDDVLSFTSAPLTSDLEIMGCCSVNIHHSSDGEADLFIRISDVDERHVARYVTEIYRRLDPKQINRDVCLTFPDCAHRFKKGHAVRLIIAGGNHPHYLRNSGTGDESRTRPVTHFVHHAPDQVSQLTLPVL